MRTINTTHTCFMSIAEKVRRDNWYAGVARRCMARANTIRPGNDCPGGARTAVFRIHIYRRGCHEMTPRRLCCWRERAMTAVAGIHCMLASAVRTNNCRGGSRTAPTIYTCIHTYRRGCHEMTPRRLCCWRERAMTAVAGIHCVLTSAAFRYGSQSIQR
jgi:hypothetical protein